tara:strand:+ start:2929 stop:4569 length:1641 start_codon:yes stop_codon:yes gene_type:complete
MFHIFTFIIFYGLILLFGRGTVLFFNKSLNKNNSNEKTLFNIPIHYFYVIIGLFYVGNLTFIINFFINTNSLIYQGLLLSIILFNFLQRIKVRFDFLSLFNFILLPSILAISTIEMGLAYDAGLYHLNNQLWIRESNLPIGFYNLHYRYGFSSIIEYISANFWLDDKYYLLHYVNLSFIASFLGIISYNIFNNKSGFLKSSSYFLILFGILDNFGFSGGRNGFFDIEAVTKQDTPFAILFYLSNIFLIYRLINKNLSKSELFYLSIIILFSIEMRIFGAGTLILYFIVLLVNKPLSINKIYPILPTVLIGSLWLLKNVLISGCLFFPVNLTCLNNLSWYSKNSALNEMDVIKDFHLGYYFGTPILSWFSDWYSKEINSVVLRNFLLSFLLIVITSMIINKRGNRDISKKDLLMICLYLIFIIIAWIISSPGIRLGLGIFTLIIGCIGLIFQNLEFRIKFLNNKALLYLLIIVSTLLMPRISNYISFIDNPFYINELKAQSINYVDKYGYGVYPEEGSQCWVKLDCVQNKKYIEKSNILFFNIFSTK